jgi:hypothetical protein
MRRLILEALGPGPMTVPEIAQAIGYPEKDVMWWVMGCVRYSFVEPTGETTPEGYRRYAVAGREED